MFTFFSPVVYMYGRDAWDMAAEICLSQLPTLVEDPNAEFQVGLMLTTHLICVVIVLNPQEYYAAIKYSVFCMSSAKSIFHRAVDSFWSMAWPWIKGQKASRAVAHSVTGMKFLMVQIKWGTVRGSSCHLVGILSIFWNVGSIYRPSLVSLIIMNRWKKNIGYPCCSHIHWSIFPNYQENQRIILVAPW